MRPKITTKKQVILPVVVYPKKNIVITKKENQSKSDIAKQKLNLLFKS